MTAPEFLEHLRDVMQLVRVRLASCKAGVLGDESIKDLQAVLGMLAKIESEIVSGTVPSKNQRLRPSVGHFALDIWGDRSQLAQRIDDLTYDYYRFLE